MKKKLRHAYGAVLTFSLLFLGFTAGIAVGHYRTFPFYQYRTAFAALRAVYEVYLVRLWEDVSDNQSLYRRNRFSGSGVVRYDEGAAYIGLTLFASSHAPKAFLMAMDGEIVHEWGLPFSAAWEDPPHIDYPVRDELVYWVKAHVYPNGDLLAIYEAPGRFPYAYGLVKVDKDSRLLWRYAEWVHHDFDLAEDGKIYTLIHTLRPLPIQGVTDPGIPAIIDDCAAILSPLGEEIKRISVVDALRNSDYNSILRWERESEDGDIIHTNSVKAVTGKIAEAHPYAEVGQLLLSMRHLGMLAVLDPESETITWAALGPWRRQHDPDFLENGNLLIFDNFGHLGLGGASRVIEVNPSTLGVVWEYTGEKENFFYSPTRSQQQRLPNGNTLIVEADAGRIFEITMDKRIVWEYINPAQVRDKIAALVDATRIDPASLTFLENEERQ